MTWCEIPQSDLSGWNQRLLQEPTASIRQYPLFNEGLRGSGGLWVSTPGRRYAALIASLRRWTTAPRYLLHRSAQGNTVFASVVSIGVPGLRFGCILDGPVALQGCRIDASVVGELVRWARANNYVALRLTHSSEEHLKALANVDRAERTNGVPFYPHPTTELYVDLLRDEKTLFAGFQAVARRNIRRAREAGYVISVDYEPHALKKAWPAFQSRSLQKGIRYRQLETYERIMCEAKPYRAGHLYTAWLKGVPMAAILVLRDCTTAHYFLGTIDADALGDAPSPACLLHWAAMREAADMGCSYYNLGTRSGTVYTFKAKFRPIEYERPSPVTLAIKPRLYQLWRRLLPAITQAVV